MANYYMHDWIRKEIIDNCSETYVYIGHYNDNQDNIVCLTYYDSNIEDIKSFGKNTVIRYPYMQLLVRDTSHQNCWARIEAIREYFKCYSYQSLTMFPKSDILHVGQDERKRTILTLNFAIKIFNGINIITV